MLGLFLLVIVGALLVLPSIQPPAAQPTPGGGEPTQVPVARVLVSQADLVRGQAVPEDAIGSREIQGLTPKQAEDRGYLLDTEANRRFLRNKITRQDIAFDQEFERDFVIDTTLYGSEAALFIPQGMVAVAFPVDRLSSVGYGIRPGDRLDVLATFLVVNVNPDTQTLTPLSTRLLLPDGTLSEEFAVGVEVNIPPDDTPVNAGPSPLEPRQRPRAVTQLTLENVLVLKLGEWEHRLGPTPVPTAVVTGTLAPRPPGQQVQEPTQTPEPLPDIVTLALPRQDALVLMYLLHSGATIEFALRAAGDQETGFNLQPVTLAYTFQRFQIEEPPKLPYATEPGLWPADLPPSVGGLVFPTPRPHPNPTPSGP